MRLIYKIFVVTICSIALYCDGNAETLYKVDWSNAIVLPFENVDSPDISPDGRKLIFIKYRELTPEIQYGDLLNTNIDGTGTKVLLPKNDANPLFDTNYTIAKWSPDGSRILLLKNVNFEMWVYLNDGAKLTSLTEKTYDKHYPAWWPDGSKIIYDIYGTDSIVNILNYNFGTGPFNVIGFGDPEIGGPKAFSPDGKTLLILDKQDLLFLNLDGTLKTRKIIKTVLPGSINPIWTPNGKYIILGNLLYALDTGEECTFLPDEVIRFKVAGKPDLIGPDNMSISKDGKKIAFLMSEKNSLSGYRARIKIMDLVWK